ncbi:adenylate cyclase type 3 [Galendromus occidentalis]|uniref:adenylate cyclase n=1 Tax=Galendromus occidentalis TaxID=34638 RepID=A0AAJ6VXT3_9ACAR|nr:adenylate cyclase type 3 [Galendromus occidentalis]
MEANSREHDEHSAKETLLVQKNNGQGPRTEQLGDAELRLDIDDSGLQRYLPRFLRFAFADADVEKQYLDYYKDEKCLDFRTWFPTASAVNVAIAGVYLICLLKGKYAAIPPIVILTCVGVLLMISARLLGTRRILAQGLLFFLIMVAIFVQMGHIVSDIYIFPIPRQASDAVAWILLYSFALYVLFPFRLNTALFCSFITAVVHVALVIDTSKDAVQDNLTQIGANLVLFVCVNLLGMMCYMFFEKLQRRAFLETRQSLEVKLVVEEESKEQERLLLSVLPKHVASELKRDLDSVVDGPFKKIYMSRHENVSILFADIVGFTAFSSTCSAADLVRTLNELFARFDKLAEKYHQLRIKILGDCYYCISGAPEERRDHAVLCVHMGLSMVEAIKSVREQTKSGIDMRVGIHTGAVLAGVLGQRQWQFDVYSRDVVLANKMESGGLPGRVHISDATLNFLDDEFEVTNADGASREEAIRLAGIRTLFITKVLKPYPEGTLDVAKSPTARGHSSSGAACVSIDAPNGPSDYRKRLQQELLERDTVAQLARFVNPFTLYFKNREYEQQYTAINDSSNCISLVAFPLITLCNGVVFLALLDSSPFSSLVYSIALIVLSILTGLCVTPLLVKSAPKTVTAMSTAVQAKSSARFAIVLVIVIGWTLLHAVTTVFAGLQANSTEPPELSEFSSLSPSSNPCPFPAYSTYIAIIGLVAVTLLTHVSYLVKLLLILLIVGVQSLLNLSVLKIPFDNFDYRVYASELDDGFILPIGHGSLLCLYLAIVGFSLIMCCRQLEYTTRRLFLWQKELDTQKQKVAEMRHKNEALIYNILPPHVAKHFLGTRKNDEELYSKSYEAVGVLFAAMPNFSDFYTEDDVNNQGLECLRFLNEVISDYDALLEQPRFKGIYKIKTIGSTYMAASGLSEDTKQEGDWEHLARLTEFALALKDTLNTINKESFNNFVLKMGINQGPITAGVIGARKPHFDIWGNTVNVASRMESTGKAGYIQVVSETKDILETFGFEFEQRGLVTVKGKGQLMTYYLIGRKKNGKNAGGGGGGGGGKT